MSSFAFFFWLKSSSSCLISPEDVSLDRAGSSGGTDGFIKGTFFLILKEVQKLPSRRLEIAWFKSLVASFVFSNENSPFSTSTSLVFRNSRAIPFQLSKERWFVLFKR
jgi:hypothetical protein